MECAFFFIFFLILFAHSTAAADSTTSPSPSPAPSSFFRPSTLVVAAVGVLTTFFSLTFLLLLYAKHCKQPAPSRGATADSAARKNSGVDRSIVESLPMFRYASLRSSKIKGRSRCLECAVCLGRFEGLEVLRLLPKCNHVFHVECVDTWLDAHSTCPLCRYRVDPEDVLLSTTTTTHHQDPDPDIEAGKGIMFQLKRISGRHSSAGERGSAAASAAAPSRRKDGQLLGCAGCGQTQSQSRLKLVARGLQQRWSDVEQSDLPYRRPPEVIMMNGNGSGRGVINSRSVSDMTGVNRFSGRESSNEIQRNGQGQGQGQGQMPSLSPTSTTTTAQPTHTVEP